MEENSNNGLSKGESSVLGEFTKEESEIPEG